MVCAATASHFCSSERQFRFPLEYGGQRTPTAQWTVTGSGACVISSEGKGPKIVASTVGRVIDYGVVDANNMGAAMAPAAADTLITHFKELNTNVDDYDLIGTGDLGVLGTRAFKDLVWEKGYDIENALLCGNITGGKCVTEIGCFRGQVDYTEIELLRNKYQELIVR